MPRLGVVIASVREGRVGRPVADWFIERARAHGHFEIDDIDLKVVNLPMFAEPNHPRLRKYESDQQKTWSARVGSLDAFVFVMPEYNYSTAPALTNAIDYLFFEWNYKPVGLVSYGGISAGLRAAQMVKPGESIVLDSGTTTAQIARFLPDTDEITVVTNDFGVLAELAAKTRIRVVVLGGSLRRKNLAFYGAQTEAAIAGLSVDKLFLGVDGLHAEKGVTTHYEREASLNRMMAEVAQQVIAVTDSSKFGRMCLHKIIDLDELDVLITDTGADESALEAVRRRDIEVIAV